jgi:hypothetical protein
MMEIYEILVIPIGKKSMTMAEMGKPNSNSRGVMQHLVEAEDSNRFAKPMVYLDLFDFWIAII